MTKPCKSCKAPRESRHGKQFCDACAAKRQRERSRLCEATRRESAEYRAKQASYHRLARQDPDRAAAHVQRSTAYARANREQVRFNAQRRRARLLDGASPGVTPQEWADIVEYFGGCCAYCLRADLPLERHHVIPIARGGRDAPDNVVPACTHCNCSKNASLIAVWYARRLAEVA